MPINDAMPGSGERAKGLTKFSRRQFFFGAGGLVAGGLWAKVLYDSAERFQRSAVFIAKADSYDSDLELVREGLSELGFGSGLGSGKSVLLKPNLVEPSRQSPHINTHPALVRATARVFRSLGPAKSLLPKAQGTAAIPTGSSTSQALPRCSTRQSSNSSTSTAKTCTSPATARV